MTLSMKEILRLTASDGCAPEQEERMPDDKHGALSPLPELLVSALESGYPSPVMAQEAADEIRRLHRWVEELGRDAVRAMRATTLPEFKAALSSALPPTGTPKGKPWDWATDEQVANQCGVDSFRLKSRADANRNFAIGWPFAESLIAVLDECERRLSARPSATLAPNIEQQIVEVIRRCGVKAGIAPETYGAICEGVREIIRLNAPTDEGRKT